MRSYVLSGTLLMLAGLGCFAGGGFLLKNTLDQGRITEISQKAAEARCLRSLKRIGVVTPENGALKVRVDEVADPRLSFSDAVAALAGCPGRPMTEFCIGSACGDELSEPIPGEPLPLRMTFTIAGG